MQLFRNIAAAMMCVSLACTGIAGAATIHVNAANPSPPGDGSVGNPFVSITNAIPALEASNAVSWGGHTVLVYSNVYLESVTLTNIHSGSLASPNMIKGTNGPVVLSGYGIILAGSSNIVLDGITVTGAVGIGISLSHADSDNVTITNCTITQCGGTGIWMADGVANTSIRNSLIHACGGEGAIYNYSSGSPSIINCVIYGNKADGWRKRFGNAIVKNSIIACNGGRGVFEFGGGQCQASYNVFYANGYCNFANGSDKPVDDINGLSYCSNNIVANPGFSDLANNWNFNQLYADSVCFTNGQGGSTIGMYPSPPTVTPSNATYYVASNGSDSHTPGEATNPGTPWASLTNAARYAGAGDTVLANAGVYTGRVNITRGGSRNPVRYLASGAVTLTGGGTYDWGIYLDRASDIQLDGFEITGCTNGGVYLYYSMSNVIRNCSIHNNTTTGVGIKRSPCTYLADLNIYSNTSYGVLCAANDNPGSLMFDRCRIYAHPTGYGCYLYSYVIAQLNNCNIYSNKFGFYNYAGGSLTFNNCVIYANSTWGCWVALGCSAYLRNTIIAGNGAGLYEGHGQGDFYCTNCCFYNNTLGHLFDENTTYLTIAQINALAGSTNNIEADPQFKNAPRGDFRISVGSMCVDAGTTNTSVATDLYGNPRLVGAAVDIGSFELQRPQGTVFMVQ